MSLFIPAADFHHDKPISRSPALWLLVALMLLALLSDVSGLDVWLENHYFDAAQQAFPLRDQPLFSHVLHDGVRKLLVISLLLMLLLSGVAARYSTVANRLPALWRQPRLFAYLAAVFLSGPLLVGLLKQVTTHNCPWNLAQYGGSLPYGDFFHVPLFSLTKAGHCFPGAHASAAFTLFAFIPLLAARWRWPAAVAVLFFGLLLGWVQMLRGAHFLSHNLWSAAIAWAVMLLWFSILQPGQVLSREQVASTVPLQAEPGEA